MGALTFPPPPSHVYPPCLNASSTTPQEVAEMEAGGAVLEDEPGELREGGAAVLQQAEPGLLLQPLEHSVPLRLPGSHRPPPRPWRLPHHLRLPELLRRRHLLRRDLPPQQQRRQQVGPFFGPPWWPALRHPLHPPLLVEGFAAPRELESILCVCGCVRACVCGC